MPFEQVCRSDLLKPYLARGIGFLSRMIVMLATNMHLTVSGIDLLISMMTSENGNIFRITGHLCGKFTGDADL